MRYLGATLLVLGFFGVPSLLHADSCMDKAQTQLDLNYCASSDFKKADNELNALYKRILSEYSDDTKFIEKLKAAQRAWLKFRDAEMEALFPHSEEGNYYGSVYPMCNSTWLMVLTKERIAQLKKWADKVQEGDVCSGSIKIKE